MLDQAWTELELYWPINLGIIYKKKKTENAIDNWSLRKRISTQQPVTNSLFLVSRNCSLGRYKSYLKSV